jgi:DNA (cytosine-5)-methyltransferase 1
LHNYGNAPYVLKDLGHASADWVRSKAGGRVDVLLGCPPCQGFSDNGHRSPWDHRNRHLRRFAMLACALKPKAIAMENVPLAVGAQAFADWTRLLEKAGYRWTAGILNAALYGSTQCRQRLIFIGIHESVGAEPILPSPTHGGRRHYFNYSTGALCSLREARTAILGTNPANFQVRAKLPFTDDGFGATNIPTVEHTLAGLPSIGSVRAQKLGHIEWAHTHRQLKRMASVREGGQPRRSLRYYASSYGRLHRRGLARTITGAFPNAGSGRFWHPTENRSLTLREAARLQGFDDDFHFLEPISQGALLIGNALDSALASVSCSVIRDCLS